MNNTIYALKTIRTLPDLGLRYTVDNSKSQGINGREPQLELSDKLNLSHMALGLASELGELVQCVGTELKTKIDLPNLKEELGDVYWYITNYCVLREIDPPINTVNNDLPEDECFELLITSISDLVDIVKKYLAYNKEIDRVAELEVVYNIYNALNLFQNIYKLDGDEIRKMNIDKLTVRYPEKFSDELAVNRNTNEERKTLES